MDFQYMIIGEKLNYQHVEGKDTKFVFDDLYVARMMIQNDPQNVDFY